MSTRVAFRRCEVGLGELLEHWESQAEFMVRMRRHAMDAAELHADPVRGAELDFLTRAIGATTDL